MKAVLTLFFILFGSGVLATPTAMAASQPLLELHIMPLECTIETIDDGFRQLQHLYPAECSHVTSLAVAATSARPPQATELEPSAFGTVLSFDAPLRVHASSAGGHTSAAAISRSESVLTTGSRPPESKASVSAHMFVMIALFMLAILAGVHGFWARRRAHI